MNRSTMPLKEINLPKPPIGNKIFVLQDHGVYVLEKGPAIIRAIMCTHAGQGSVYILDGIPGANGFCPEEHLQDGDPGWEMANGRLIWLASPSIMGMWMADGGTFHGLTIVINGSNSIAAPTVIATWLPHTPTARRIIDEPGDSKNQSKRS